MTKNIRLTNDMRDTFIAKVMADVPSKPYEDEVRDAANKAAHDALPATIKKLLKDAELAPFVTKVHLGLDHENPENTSRYGSMSFILPGADDKTVRAAVVAAVKPICKAWVEQDKTHKELRAKLRSVAYHCTSRNQLAEAFPEFAHYLPAVEADATRNLPALANVVTDFVKAGWPKGKKPARAAAAA